MRFFGNDKNTVRLPRQDYLQCKNHLQNKGLLAVEVEFTKDLPEMRLGYH